MPTESIAETYTVNDAKDAAREYISHGFAVVPVAAFEKAPKGKAWQNSTYGPEQFGPNSNIGVKGGKASRDIVPLDLDCPEARAAATMLLPPTLASGHGGNLGHRWFRVSGLPDGFYYMFKDHHGETLIEVRGDGKHQTLLPGSVHPSGERYEWDGEFDPSRIADITADDLLRRTHMIATAAIVARNMPVGGRHGLANALAGLLLENGLGDADAERILEVAWAVAGADHDGDLYQAVPDTRDKIDNESPYTHGRHVDEATGKKVSDTIRKVWGWEKSRGGGEKPTDDVLRDRFIEANPNHAYGQDEWKTYRGGVWEPEEEHVIERRVTRVLEAAKPQGIRPTALLVNSVTRMTRSELFVSPRMWDADPDTVACANGDLHLPSRTLEQHNPRTYATQKLPYAYDPKAECEVWESFVRNTLPEEYEFLQEFAGYCLTTDTALETAIWMQGTRGSGKSTFLEGLLAMLGHRAGRLGLRDIEQSRFGLTGIQGRTLLVASEQPNLYLQSTDTLDALISGEPVTVDRKYREPQTIRPVAKLVWAMNDLPRIGNSTSGVFRRVKVVKFPDPANAPNPMVKEVIKTEGAGILNWALDGLNRLQTRGSLLVPGSVAAATQEFQCSNDVPALYVAENCATGPNMSVQAGLLYQDYRRWCEDNGHKPLSSTRMAGEWERLGFGKKQTNKGAFYEGISLV